MPKPLGEITSGHSMIDVLWAAHDVKNMTKDEAYFLWDTNKSFREDIKDQYCKLLVVLDEEASLKVSNDGIRGAFMWMTEH